LTELIDRLAATYEIVADRETTATIEAALDSLGALGAVDAVDRR
jgi:hypothetical protein